MSEESNENGAGIRYDDADAVQGSPAGNARTYNSAELLADAREIIIEHAGAHYRLRTTRKGGLILTK